MPTKRGFRFPTPRQIRDQSFVIVNAMWARTGRFDQWTQQPTKPLRYHFLTHPLVARKYLRAARIVRRVLHCSGCTVASCPARPSRAADISLCITTLIFHMFRWAESRERLRASTFSTSCLVPAVSLEREYTGPVQQIANCTDDENHGHQAVVRQ